MRFGRYLIGMNASTDRTFPLQLPPEATKITDLGSGLAVPIGKQIEVKPMLTAVLLIDG